MDRGLRPLYPRHFFHTPGERITLPLMSFLSTLQTLLLYQISILDLANLLDLVAIRAVSGVHASCPSKFRMPLSQTDQTKQSKCTPMERKEMKNNKPKSNLTDSDRL